MLRATIDDSVTVTPHNELLFMYSISAMLGLSVWQLSQVGIKEVSQEALHPDRLGGLSSRDQRWIQSQVQDLCGDKRCGATLGCVETLDGTGQPDESFETLDVSAAVVHQLVLSHSSATAGRESREREGSFSPHQHSILKQSVQSTLRHKASYSKYMHASKSGHLKSLKAIYLILRV